MPPGPVRHNRPSFAQGRPEHGVVRLEVTKSGRRRVVPRRQAPSHPFLSTRPAGTEFPLASFRKATTARRSPGAAPLVTRLKAVGGRVTMGMWFKEWLRVGAVNAGLGNQGDAREQARSRNLLGIVLGVLLVLPGLGACTPAMPVSGEAGLPATVSPPAGPWPRELTSGDNTFSVFQPQYDRWEQGRLRRPVGGGGGEPSVAGAPVRGDLVHGPDPGRQGDAAGHARGPDCLQGRFPDRAGRRGRLRSRRSSAPSRRRR